MARRIRSRIRGRTWRSVETSARLVCWLIGTSLLTVAVPAFSVPGRLGSVSRAADCCAVIWLTYGTGTSAVIEPPFGLPANDDKPAPGG